jgi:predicted transcriptional regulator
MPGKQIRSMDSKLVESVYSVEEQEYTDYMEGLSVEEIRSFLGRLPAKEQDLVELFLFRKKRQKDIAKMFNITQGAVSHRLSRARKRLWFLKEMPKVDDNVLRARLKEQFTPMDADIVYHMTKTTCQSLVAKIINKAYNLEDKQCLTQVKVRHKFFKAIDKLGELGKTDPVYERIHALTVHIRKGSYLLHEVKLPHFDKGTKSIFCLG